jgi:hypothetical protein
VAGEPQNFDLLELRFVVSVLTTLAGDTLPVTSTAMGTPVDDELQEEFLDALQDTAALDTSEYTPVHVRKAYITMLARRHARHHATFCYFDDPSLEANGNATVLSSECGSTACTNRFRAVLTPEYGW